MRKSFLPNMTPSTVAAVDRQRGRDGFSTFPSPNGIVQKQPWLNPDGTHKSTDEEDENMPLPPKREGESEFQRDIRHYTDVVEDNPKKYTGGRKQAIAIAAHEAGVAKKSGLGKALEGLKKFVLSSAHAPTGTAAPHGSMTGVQAAGGHSGMVSPKAHAALNAVQPAMAKPKMGGVAKPPPIPGAVKSVDKCGDGIAEMLDGMHETKKADPQARASSQREQARRFGKRERDIHAHQMLTAKSLTGAGPLDAAVKALNSRNFPVLPPRGQYDPFGIVQRGRDVPVHRDSPAEHFTTAPVNAAVYDSCATHGTMHKSGTGCRQCAVQKSQVCKSCGTPLVKSRERGGALTCPKGH